MPPAVLLSSACAGESSPAPTVKMPSTGSRFAIWSPAVGFMHRILSRKRSAVGCFCTRGGLWEEVLGDRGPSRFSGIRVHISYFLGTLATHDLSSQCPSYFCFLFARRYTLRACVSMEGLIARGRRWLPSRAAYVLCCLAHGRSDLESCMISSPRLVLCLGSRFLNLKCKISY